MLPSPLAAEASARRFKHAYTSAREDLHALVPAACRRLRDGGCATGAFGLAIKPDRADAVVVGVEIDPELARIAGGRLDRELVAYQYLVVARRGRANPPKQWSLPSHAA